MSDNVGEMNEDYGTETMEVYGTGTSKEEKNEGGRVGQELRNWKGWQSFEAGGEKRLLMTW